MTRLWMCVILAVVMAAPMATAAEKQVEKPLIQMAILLDNSGSMSGLISQARTQLWSIVNEFATTRKGGQVPELQVALYIYGNPPPTLLLPLTNDLDKASEKLFAVRISGGSEYCGQVITEAVNKLAWSKSNNDLKVIFIAGNERFTQGPIDYRKACKAAIEKGIIVNTIHCGPKATGIAGKWQDGAALADGRFMNIDQNQTVVAVNAPQDKKIAALNAKLNTTYVAYGAMGRGAAERQRAQDANAAKSGSMGSRVTAKASAQYRNASWDLVDALKDGKVKVEDIKEADLPENMRKMSVAERKKYVAGQATARVKIQKQIRTLGEERAKYVSAELKKLGKADNSLGTAMRKAAREQAAKKNFSVKAEK
jgi:von Willebrand factor type A domain-containing protein